MNELNSIITELRKARNLATNRKLKWENTIKELKSLNRTIDVGELKCMDCNSKNIAYSTSTKRRAYVFDVSTVEMRTDIINSINEKIEAYEEEIEKYDISIAKEQEKLRDVMNDKEITLEALIELKDQIFSASDAENRISEIEQEISTLENKLSISENSTKETKNKREDVMKLILNEMNALYKIINPNGNFQIVKLYALQKILGHEWPIIIDSFRAEDLSTNNHIDYKDHAPSKMLSPEYCDQFKQLVSDFAFNID